MTTSNKFEQYYIGLDIGTNSVGWACTDKDYNILRHRGQDMWGVHLFDEAQSAIERRGFRTARRRRERQVNRIAWVRELMKEEIFAVDPLFFQRLEDSGLHVCDRRDRQSNTLFNDENYTDRDFHRSFPTAYHLRAELMKHPERKFDIRLIYLAIAHIMKSRGNFLYQGARFDANSAFEDSYRIFIKKISESLNIHIPEGVEEQVHDALQLKGIKRKSEVLQKSWAAKGNKPLLEIIKLLAGGKAKPSTIFTLKDDDSNDELVEMLKAVEEAEFKDFSFSKNDYEETLLPILESMLDDDALQFFENAKKLYDWSILSNILGNHATLSDAMIAQSQFHRHDLAVFKHLVRKYAPGQFVDFFKKRNSPDNYQAWIGRSTVKNNKSVCAQDIFYKAVKALFRGHENASDVKKWIFSKIEDNSFLNKLRISSNGVIPYQLHLMELERILDNATKFYPFLKNKDESGLSVKDKITQILTFRIPYYVGPLSDKHLAETDSKHGHAWIVRNPGFEHTPIRPWNFEQVVNLNACGEAFIRRMTAKCTYLPTCDVLPKQSLLYSEYLCLNQLNNLKLDGHEIDRESKKEIFELCKVKRNVGKRDILNALNPRPTELGGFDGDIKLSLKSYHDFKDILGAEDLSKDTVRDFVENCILACTIFGEASDQLDHRIQSLSQKYHFPLTSEQRKRISRLRYKDWGKFSREFLTEIDGYNKQHGDCYSIREALEEETDNLMQLLSKNNYSFSENIDKYNKEHGKPCHFTYESLVKGLYCSPAVKRAIWRTLVVVKDLVRVAKHAPTRIFVEMARDDGNKKQAQKGKRTKSRKDQLSDLYNNMKVDKELDKSLIEEFRQHLDKYTDDDLRKSKDRLYLYFTQCGKCMYSGETIDLNSLLGDKNGTIWDIDHIYPQSKVVDNSLDNRVLVKKSLNNIKQDRLPLESGIVKEKAKQHWKYLLENHFISKEKYERLTRNNPLTAEDLAGFINRQLVETRQTTKVVCETLRNVFGNKTSIVYSHAGRVSEFRRVHTHEGAYEFVKCREINDHHHAKDAYLNIVVGNLYHTKFTGDPSKIFSDEKVNVQLYTDNQTGLLQHEISRFDPTIGKMVTAWKPGKSLSIVKRWMRSSRILVTRFAYENRGGFYDQQPLKAEFCKTVTIQPPCKKTVFPRFISCIR